MPGDTNGVSLGRRFMEPLTLWYFAVIMMLSILIINEFIKKKDRS